MGSGNITHDIPSEILEYFVMKIKTLWGEEKLDIPSKMCRECREILPFTSFSIRNKTKKKPELLNTCKKCKSKHDKVVDVWKKCNPKPDADYKCPICKETSAEIRSRGGFHEHQPKDVWAVDVEHSTMTVRGWVCDYCNNMVGRSLDRDWVMERGSRWVNDHESMSAEVNPIKTHFYP